MRVSNQNVGNTKSSELGSSKKTDQAAKAGESKTAANTKASPAADTAGSANIQVSDEAREMSQAKEIATAAPDIREAKIAELKRRIAAKQYNVKPEEIADKMVDEHIRTRQISQ